MGTLVKVFADDGALPLPHSCGSLCCPPLRTKGVLMIVVTSER